MTRTLPMARSVIRCQGAVGAGRAWELMQQHSRGTEQLQVSPLASWDQRCHCDCSWAHAWQRRTKQNPVSTPLAEPIPVQSGGHRAPGLLLRVCWELSLGHLLQPGSAGEELVDADWEHGCRPCLPLGQWRSRAGRSPPSRARAQQLSSSQGPRPEPLY